MSCDDKRDLLQVHPLRKSAPTKIPIKSAPTIPKIGLPSLLSFAMIFFRNDHCSFGCCSDSRLHQFETDTGSLFKKILFVNKDGEMVADFLDFDWDKIFIQ